MRVCMSCPSQVYQKVDCYVQPKDVELSANTLSLQRVRSRLGGWEPRREGHFKAGTCACRDSLLIDTADPCGGGAKAYAARRFGHLHVCLKDNYEKHK